MVPAHTLIAEIDAFLASQDMAESAFGKAAVGDPNFLQDLRAGRELRFSTMKRVRAFMDQYEGAAA